MNVFNEPDNELVKDADAYLWKHKIQELFEDMLTIVCHKRPENLEQFLVEMLKQRKENGAWSQVYSEAELQNIFQLYDLKSENYIT